MKASKTILLLKYRLYSIIMLAALAWLTISLPFVYAEQQAQEETVQKQYDNPPAEDDNNSATNTTEEKTAGANTLSEYLHETHSTEHPGSLVVKSYIRHSSDLYIAFHPELISPPPDALAS